jgi:outer membrane protein assembly factor BamB
VLRIRSVDSRRVLMVGVAGLVPAVLVTLLLVHQPSIGARRLYPMLRASLAAVGLGLALVTLLMWASATARFSRASLTGLGWAGVTVLLCIGPFLESTPRARLYALELGTGDVMWASSRVAAEPRLVGEDLVVTDADAGWLVGLDPATGRERWRQRSPDVDTVRPVAARTDSGISVVDGHIEADGSGSGRSWTLVLEAETVLVVAEFGGAGYAYVSTPGPTEERGGGAVVSFDTEDGDVRWRRALPGPVAVRVGTPAIGASGGAVVVAGGERIGVLDADDGRMVWTQSVVSLGRSRGYATRGAVHRIVVTDSVVFLSVTPSA